MERIYSGVEKVTKKVENVVETTDQVIVPLRRSAFRRFPTMFTLLVTFGVGATFFGIERIITVTPWLSERPWFIFASGIFILAVTGSLHKKLD